MCGLLLIAVIHVISIAAHTPTLSSSRTPTNSRTETHTRTATSSTVTHTATLTLSPTRSVLNRTFTFSVSITANSTVKSSSPPVESTTMAIVFGVILALCLFLLFLFLLRGPSLRAAQANDRTIRLLESHGIELWSDNIQEIGAELQQLHWMKTDAV